MTDQAPRSKDALRRYMKDLRRALDPELAARASARAAEHLLAQPEIDTEVVCCFVSRRREIETRGLIAALLDRGVTVAVPRVAGDELELRRLARLSDLEPGAFEVPTSSGERLDERVGAFVVPGLAFTPEGGRIGYGAGYYDRTLARLDAPALGFGFERQILPTLPIEDHDVPLCAVVTDSGVHRGWPDRAIRVVAGAVIRNRRVLATRRGPGQSQAGWWELPGGKVELGESEPEALRRELAEELSIQVDVHEPVAESIHPYPGVEVALSAWSCTLVDGEPHATEHDQLGWFDADGLRRLAWAPADIPLVARVAALVG